VRKPVRRHGLPRREIRESSVATSHSNKECQPHRYNRLRAVYQTKKSPCEALAGALPCRFIYSGRSGCGKTNVLVNLLTRERLFGKCFDRIYIFSPNAFADTRGGQGDHTASPAPSAATDHQGSPNDPARNAATDRRTRQQTPRSKRNHGHPGSHKTTPHEMQPHTPRFA
jgi:hypothetical protein